MSANEHREVNPEDIELYRRQCSQQWRRERVRGQCIENILYEKRYWFDSLRQEEEDDDDEIPNVPCRGFRVIYCHQLTRLPSVHPFPAQS